MSRRLAPIYRTRRTRFEIDRCGPQVLAVQEGKIEFHALSKGHYPGVRMRPGALPGLNSIGYWDASRTQDWGLDPHRNEGVEITFLETGAMDLTVDERRFALHAGDFTITRPWQLHKRLERAPRLICEMPDRSITAIAFESGFNSSQYFATAFRKRFRTTPRAYRIHSRRE